MTEAPATEVPLVNHLIELAEKQDRAALAALRTGLGKPPGAAMRMLPIVAPFLTADEGPTASAAFVIAALFAKHPHHARASSIGASLWKATKWEGANPDGKHGEAGVAARFARALDAEPQDLPRHLEGLVALCESAGVPIDWHRLFGDLRGLLGTNEAYQTRIRTRWARDFWRSPGQPIESSDAAKEETDE
ncbi:MAG: hypothetical protein A49_26720 [Methyloceanibacter sp.]|nr:MAG: hypothetical protein A49_26720 [Methyloceanibacter sp.]